MKKEYKEFLIDLINRELEQEYNCLSEFSDMELYRNYVSKLIDVKKELLKYKNKLSLIDFIEVSDDIQKYVKLEKGGEYESIRRNKLL